MKARMIIIVMLLLLPKVFVAQEQEKFQKIYKKSILDLLNVIQFRDISYNTFVDRYKSYSIFSMDYDDNHLPRRIIKAPDSWKIDINGLVFKDLSIIFLNNQIDYVSLAVKNKGKFTLDDFINSLVEQNKGKIISKDKNKIVIELNDEHKTKLECHYPLDYHEPDVRIFISMK